MTDALGDEVLEAVNDAMVALHERHHGRKPATSRTHMTEDMLVCRLGGVYTEVEKTLIELEQTVTVQETRTVPAGAPRVLRASSPASSTRRRICTQSA